MTSTLGIKETQLMAGRLSRVIYIDMVHLDHFYSTRSNIASEGRYRPIRGMEVSLELHGSQRHQVGREMTWRVVRHVFMEGQ